MYLHIDGFIAAEINDNPYLISFCFDIYNKSFQLELNYLLECVESSDRWKQKKTTTKKQLANET